MEHLNNLPPFYVGQKVVYITGENMPKGTTDIVTRVKKNNCNCCDYLIETLKHKCKDDYTSNSKFVACEDCGCICSIEEENENRNYWFASSWRPLQEQTFPLISMKKVLEEQLVCSN